MALAQTAFTIERIPSGDAGIRATVARMIQLAQSRSLTPVMRSAAVSVVRFADGRDPLLQARLLRDWIDARCQWLADPTLAEALHDPLEVLGDIARNGIARVDCDDVATLAAALALAIGLKPRFVVAAFCPSRRFSHVWTEIRTPIGWFPIDPIRPHVSAPTPCRTMIVPAY